MLVVTLAAMPGQDSGALTLWDITTRDVEDQATAYCLGMEALGYEVEVEVL